MNDEFKRGAPRMRKNLHRIGIAIATLVVAGLLSCFATVAAASDKCARPVEGSEITQPPDIYSQDGVLSVTLHYYTTVDDWNRTLFCYVTPDGLESPTLHVNPG